MLPLPDIGHDAVGALGKYSESLGALDRRVDSLTQLGHSPLGLLDRGHERLDHHPCGIRLVSVACHGLEPVIRVLQAAEKVGSALVQLRTDLPELRHPHLEFFERFATLVQMGCGGEDAIRHLPHVIDVRRQIV